MARIPGPEVIIGLMVGLLIMAYTLPMSITTLQNTSIGTGPAGQLWGILPLLAVVVVIMWMVKAIRK